MTNWKVIAIVFIILFVVETAVFVGVILIGMQGLKEEQICGTKCASENYNSYIYDVYTEICECYLDGELKKTEVFK